jgi:cytochrome c oxidase cbb3-type subunit 3
MKKFSTIQIVLFIVTLVSTTLFAQDGEALFKAKCNTCHLVDKASTGPILKGVKQKWTDAGETEMLYDWVKNSTGLIAGGKSKMANEIKGFSPMEMTAQTVSNEEIDAILGFVDTYVPQATMPATTDGVTVTTVPEVDLKPNYKENLTTFNWLIVTIILLLITLLVLSNSIINLVKSDFFKNKLIEQAKQKEDNNSNNGIITILAVILTIGSLLWSGNSMALSFNGPGEAEGDAPWLLVENGDIYLLIAVNLFLVGIVFYLKSMFNRLLNMVYQRKVNEKIQKVKPLKKLNQVLTDVVPIEEEHKILMDHEYDGIRELDNNLPPWWVWGFFFTIVFAFCYLFNYHILGTGDLQYTAYDKEMKKADIEVKAYLSKMEMNVDETNATFMKDGANLSKGKALFETNCVTCHNPKGEGNIGPNLTDKNWIYGYDIKDVFKTIKLGTPNGMPEHNSKFNPLQIQQVASFVLSLPDTKGKESQGEFIEK